MLSFVPAKENRLTKVIIRKIYLLLIFKDIIQNTLYNHFGIKTSIQGIIFPGSAKGVSKFPVEILQLSS